MIRKANTQDIKAIYDMLQQYGKKGELLPRPLSNLYDHVRDFWVYESDGKIIGCCALQFCWDDLAEIRSLAVHSDYLKKHIGSDIVNACLSEAKNFKIIKVFALTYKPLFFQKFNFNQIDREKLPLKIWGDCISCVKFPDCDEIAMMKEL